MSPGVGAYYPQDPLATQEDGEAEHAKGLNLQRFSRPEEVAYAVLYLASDEASNITGIVLRSRKDSLDAIS